jgi:hypothetical protein
MENNKKIAVGLDAPTTKNYSKNDFIKQIKKTTLILKLLYEGKSLNRFEAEHYNDHCLNSTISSIENYGIAINRTWESVPCLLGKSTIRVKRYWLDFSPENISKTKKRLQLSGGANE